MNSFGSLRLNKAVAIHFLLVVILTPNAFSQAGIPVQQFSYRMEAHTLRACTSMGWALKNTSFINQFPKFKNVNINKFISACTTHDITKRAPVSQSGRANISSERLSRQQVREELARDFGVNKYNLDPSDPRIQQMNKAVDDLNYYDKRATERVLRSLNFTDEEKKLYLLLEEAADKTDRFMNCPPAKVCAEWGKVVEPGSKWIQDPQGKAIAEFFEKDMGREKYLQLTQNLRDEKYLQQRSLAPSKSFREIREEHLKDYLIAKEKAPSPGRAGLRGKSLGVLGKIAKPLPVVGSLIIAEQARARGQSPLEATVADLLLINGENICENQVCSKADGKQQFFNQPLHEQSQARLKDHEVNRLLNNDMPFVQGIRCDRNMPGGRLRVTLTVIPDNSDMPKPVLLKLGESRRSQPLESDILRTQEIVFSKTGQVLEATTSNFDDNVKFGINYENGIARNIQSHGLSHQRHDMTMQRFREIRPRWEKPLITTKEWLRQRDISQLGTQVETNQNAILNCCHDKKCLEFYRPTPEGKSFLNSVDAVR